MAEREVTQADRGASKFSNEAHRPPRSVAGDVVGDHAGREAGFAGQDGSTARPVNIPKFIEFDKLPLPTAKNPLLVSVLNDNNLKPKNSCN